MKKQFNSLRILSASLIAIVALTGCQKGGNSSSSSSGEDSSSTTQTEKTYYLSGVNQNANYAKYLSNIAIDSSRDDGFKVRTNPFRVGDDNNFKFKPILTVIDNDLNPASESNWDKPFQIKVEVKNGESYATAESSLYEIVDAKECVIQFKEGAVGKSFRLTVIPTGVAESRIDDYTQVLNIDVVDGYNVYDAKEIGYIDTRKTTHSTEEMPLTAWDSFKTANGMSTSLKPQNLIFQHDVVLTLNDLPAEVVYGKDDHGATHAGSMRDWAGVYRLEEDRNITIYGNYFQLNFSALPLITYYESGDSHVTSHAMLFDVVEGDFTVRDINITGNAKYATEDGEDKYAGGLMFAKARYHANSANANNVIARESFITFMGEDTETEKGYVDFVINDSKFSNNYNSFLYNWGGKMIANRSDFTKCGGPIIIQDHTDVEDGEKYESDDYTTINGHAPYVEFNDCKLENYVVGTEAWFVQFGVTGIVGQVKSMSDLYYQNGLSFVVDSKEHKPALASAATSQNPCAFNFIVINKTGTNEGATALPACGQVVIKNGETTDSFNYQQPTMEDLQAYVTLNTFLAEKDAAIDAYTGGDGGAALQALFTKWEFAPAAMDQESITAAITQKAMELKAEAQVTINHAALRGCNTQGAPVFETAGGLGYYNPNVDANHMQPLDNAVSGVTDPMAATDPFVTGAKNYTSIYYNGMMLIMALYKVEA